MQPAAAMMIDGRPWKKQERWPVHVHIYTHKTIVQTKIRQEDGQPATSRARIHLCCGHGLNFSWESKIHFAHILPHTQFELDLRVVIIMLMDFQGTIHVVSCPTGLCIHPDCLPHCKKNDNSDTIRFHHVRHVYAFHAKQIAATVTFSPR